MSDHCEECPNKKACTDQNYCEEYGHVPGPVPDDTQDS